MSLKHYFNEGLAIAITNAAVKSPIQIKTAIQQVEDRIHALSQDPDLLDNPGLAKAVAELEHILLTLKGL